VCIINETNWLCEAGYVILSNSPATTFSTGVLVHTPVSASITNQPISHFQTVLVKPSFTQRVSLWLYLTNNIGWSYQAVRGGGKPVFPTYASGTTGWTNIFLSITNPVPMSANWKVWVTSYSTNALAPGWSWMSVQDAATSHTFMQ